MKAWLCFLTAVFISLPVNAQETRVAIALHGGAGTIERSRMTDEQALEYSNFLDEAITEGYKQLKAGEPGLDVVVNIIQRMENSTLFNAGRGAVYTWEGDHELDASIMHGLELDAGAVAGVKTVKSPIALARAVMERSPHVMLASEGAEQFAKEQGFEKVPEGYFDTERRQKSLESYKRARQAGLSVNPDYKYGTVGVAVLDSEGNLVAGTSTGGMTGKRWGRIGDAPVIGAGTYANNASCAVSATGHGEYFIRHTVARDICARMELAGETLTEAADQVVHKTLVEAGGDGGIIAVDAKGNVALTFNTPGMYRASIDASGNKVVGIFGEDG